MTLIKPLTLAPLALAALLTTAAAQEAAPVAEPVTADTVLATINGERITAGHLILMRAQLPQQYQTLPPEALYDGLLQQAISQALLSQSVEEMGRAAELALENEARALRANIAMRDLSVAAVSDESLQAAYDAQFADAAPTNEYRAAHILVETEEEAAALKTQIDGGADFAAMAREHSTGPSGPNGGDLGWFGAGTMVPDFEAAVTALAPGQVSDPVQTQFGWHIIKLEETRVKGAPALDDVRDDLAEGLQQEAIEARLAELQAEAEVTQKGVDAVGTEFLSDPSLLDE